MRAPGHNKDNGNGSGGFVTNRELSLELKAIRTEQRLWALVIVTVTTGLMKLNITDAVQSAAGHLMSSAKGVIF